MGASVRRGCIAVACSALLVLVACSNDGTKQTTDTDVDQPANNPGQQQNTDTKSDTDASKKSAAGPTSVSFKRAQTCHTTKLAGGNSDVLIEFEAVNANEGDHLTFGFSSSEQGILTAEGIVRADGKVFVRLPVVAIGETLTLTQLGSDNNETEPVSGVPVPIHTVPDKDKSECDLDSVETDANGTINQPNAYNAAANAN